MSKDSGKGEEPILIESSSEASQHDDSDGEDWQFKTHINTVTGNVTKKAIKYVTVDTGAQRWKVPANMLEVL